MGDRIVAMREQESVALRPFRVLGLEIHCMTIRHSKHIGIAERLANIALSLNLTHLNRVAPNSVGALRQCAIGWFLLHDCLRAVA